MIVVQELSKYYGQRAAIESISFRAERGEIVGLLGVNGAGKSTTMRVIAGYIPPTRGRVELAGHDLLDDPLTARAQVGYLPERVPLYPDMTVEGYVLFWARLRRTPRAAERTRHVLERFDLWGRRRQLVRALSKGLKQRLGLAQAIVHNPPIVILDEPTIGIDPQQVVEVRQFIHELRDHHAVLFSSHLLAEVEQVCDRAIILHQGRVRDEVRLSQLGGVSLEQRFMSAISGRA
ncbi:MAG: ABC transporter ATP-binding protein [Anaerolineae bacterium]|nr:ABC transporter ATP-binding protein [Anaerolineae bacterium]MDW8173101.1 ABC transporter ATP-binding protein [Anaerolineae bacterium]